MNTIIPFAVDPPVIAPFGAAPRPASGRAGRFGGVPTATILPDRTTGRATEGRQVLGWKNTQRGGAPVSMLPMWGAAGDRGAAAFLGGEVIPFPGPAD